MMFFKKKRKWSVGIDYTSNNVKVVCLNQHNNGHSELMAYGAMRKDSPSLSGMAKELSKHSVRVNIEDPSLKIRRVELPKMPDNEIAEAVKYAFKKVIDIKLDEYVLQYRKLPHDESEVKIPLIVYAIKKDVIASRLDDLKSMGFQRIDVLEPSPASLIFLLNNINHENRQDPIAFIDMGATKSLFNVVKEGHLISSRTMASLSGRHLTEQISRDLGISLEDAEHKKINWHEGEDDPVKDRLLNTISIYASSASLEIQRSIDAHFSYYSNDNISQLFLIGGGSMLPGIHERLSSALGLPVKLINPFENIKLNESVNKGIENKRALFGIACGLALGD